MYANLVNAAPGLKRSVDQEVLQGRHLRGEAGRRREDRAPARRRHDRSRQLRGPPHLRARRRPGAMFGAGYAAAEDRLFFMDALRHAGRAELSSFAGGSNAAMDASVWADTPYNEADLQEQYDRAPTMYGKRGVQIQHDTQNYVAGINQFIAEACVNQTRLPGGVRPDRPEPEHLPAGAPVDGRRRHLDRVAGRRDLRQGRRRRAQQRAHARRPRRSGSATGRARRSTPTSCRPTTPRPPPRSTARASPTASRPSIRAALRCRTPAPSSSPTRARRAASDPATRHRRGSHNRRPRRTAGSRTFSRRCRRRVTPPTRCSSPAVRPRAATRLQCSGRRSPTSRRRS